MKMITLSRRAFWICGLVMLVLSLVPTTPEMPSTGWDKSNHFLGFAVLTVLGLVAYARQTGPVLVGVFLYGGLIEVLQSFTTYRSAEWGDLMADAVGIAGGLLLHRIAIRVFRLRT